MCDLCNIARQFPEHPRFCPSCIFCGARIIQLLGKLPIGVTECTTRRQQSLAVWVEWGHSEQEIRRLAKGSLALGLEKDKDSDRQTKTKPLFRGQRSGSQSERG